MEKEDEKLRKKAFDLGYEVGYFDHDEFASWAHNELRFLQKEAREVNFSEDIVAIYTKGKEEGIRGRATRKEGKLKKSQKKKAKKVSSKKAIETVKKRVKKEKKAEEKHTDPTLTNQEKNRD